MKTDKLPWLSGTARFGRLATCLAYAYFFFQKSDPCAYKHYSYKKHVNFLFSIASPPLPWIYFLLNIGNVQWLPVLLIEIFVFFRMMSDSIIVEKRAESRL